MMTRRVSCRQGYRSDGQYKTDGMEPLRSTAGLHDCSGYTTRYEYDRYGQQTAVTGKKASALTAVITRAVNWSAEGCAGAGDPL